LLGELLHSLPWDEQRGEDDRSHRRSKQDLALGRQRDAQLAEALEHRDRRFYPNIYPASQWEARLTMS